MCFPSTDIKTPELPIEQGADEVKSGAYKQAKKRRGYQSTVFPGQPLGASGTAAGSEPKKKLTGE